MGWSINYVTLEGEGGLNASIKNSDFLNEKPEGRKSLFYRYVIYGQPPINYSFQFILTRQICLFFFQFPELNPMIMRRFEEPGDVERAFELVHKSQGLEQTRFLARKHCIEAIRLAQELSESPYQKGLIVVNDFVLNRMK